MEVIWGFL